MVFRAIARFFIDYWCLMRGIPLYNYPKDDVEHHKGCRCETCRFWGA